MTDSYILMKKQRDELDEIKNQTLFGLVSGAILISIGFISFLTAKPGSINYLYLLEIIAGGTLFFCAVIIPQLLQYPYKLFYFATNKIGNMIFKLLLSVIYFLFILPVGMLVYRRKRRLYGFYSWKQISMQSISTFSRKKEHSYGVNAGNKKASYQKTIFGLLGNLMSNKRYILIPVVLFMAFLGLLLFFLSSHVLTMFVYTLF